MNTRQQFQNLFQPSRIGQIEIKNRIVMPPMVTKYADVGGFVNERIIDYYEERARGGVGLIIVEATYVDSRGRIFETQLGISDDKFIRGLRKLVQAIHRHGAKAAIQIHHGGKQAKPDLSGVSLLAPSRIPGAQGKLPQELTVSGIKEIIRYFADGATRAKNAGFDAIEIHGATHYLIAQFLSAFSNKRQDAYGGNLQNRARFLIEIIRAVKAAVGADYPVWCRINGKEYGIEDGITLEEAREIACMAQDAGSDAIHVSAFGPVSSFFGPPSPLQDGAFPLIPGNNVPLADGIKKMVTVPVIAAGGISPEAGEKILEEGRVDLIAMGRALLADPQLPNKVLSGQSEDVKPCIFCLRCRDDLYLPETGIGCSVNSSLGREKECQIKPAKTQRKILVVGGGPAGLETARVAALRGHQVTLYERENRLGGQLIPAALPPTKSRIEALTTYFETQIRKLGVRIELGKEVNSKLLEEINPDVVVLATGSTPFTPEIHGIEKGKLVHAIDVLQGDVALDEKVFIIGGELVGCETAEFIAEKGKKVTVARRGAEMALGLSLRAREALLARLSEKGVTLLTGVKYEKITPQGLVLTTKEGERETIEADIIVLAAGSLSNRALFDEVKGQALEIHLAGDCVKPRRIREAIAEGFQIASLI